MVGRDTFGWGRDFRDRGAGMEAGGSGVGVLWLCCEGGDLVTRLL